MKNQKIKKSFLLFYHISNLFLLFLILNFLLKRQLTGLFEATISPCCYIGFLVLPLFHLTIALIIYYKAVWFDLSKFAYICCSGLLMLGLFGWKCFEFYDGSNDMGIRNESFMTTILSGPDSKYSLLKFKQAFGIEPDDSVSRIYCWNFEHSRNANYLKFHYKDGGIIHRIVKDCPLIRNAQPPSFKDLPMSACSLSWWPKTNELKGRHINGYEMGGSWDMLWLDLDSKVCYYRGAASH